MRVRLLSLFIALALLPLAAVAQDAPAPVDEPAQDAAPVADDDPDALDTGAAKVPLEEIRRYVTVFNAIRQAYVDPVDDHKLMSAAVRGLLFDLDPHSAYMEKADAEQFDYLVQADAGIGTRATLAVHKIAAHREMRKQ